MTVQDSLSSVVPPDAKPVVAYDFSRPTTLAREHTRVLEMAFETFARQWGTQLTAKVRVLSQVTREEVQVLSYDEYAGSLPDSTCMVLFDVVGISAKAVIQFPIPAALTWVGHMLGGTGTQNVPERKFTHIEQALLDKIMDDAVEDLQYSLGHLMASPLSMAAVHYNSQFAQAAAARDAMIVAGFEMVVGDSAEAATIAIPAAAILPRLDPLGAQSSSAPAAELVQLQLAHVPVKVCLQLEPITVLPAMVLNLAVGDVLNLGHPRHRPLNVTVDGQTMAQAAVGASGSRLAGSIVSIEEN